MPAKKPVKIPYRIVQVVVDNSGQLIALCDDGSVWARVNDGNDCYVWHEAPLGPAYHFGPA